jgi:hypothetical protein
MPHNTKNEALPLSVIGADISVSSSPSNDQQALKEAQAFDNDDLEAQSRKANHDRTEELKKVVHWLFKWGVRTAGLALIMVFIVRVAHFILPESCTWLSTDRINDIDRLMFSGALGGLLAKYLGPVMDNGKK